MNANGSRLSGISKELYLQWHETRAVWRDTKSDEFQQKYLEELFASVDKTVTAIEQLDKLVTKIRQDCE